ncbi:PTS sugar transporter subunit IIB [Ligilactobacillus salivarius]|uniref:PTS sugar transporter subunit IIB n=2 Tax=Ligilactobacillus salivarius TaxID=1624 RepID=A0AAW7N819_9LACO|nr:PTS sugar transporter subunit IIB [Ligilactobacillus salivarius]ATP36409.1 PTS fructose transporter subunit IIB [Ligilactobacillus salivarius]MDN4834329.1 PTS sugar transporter subunit IIB [Ligilactobacillus salivarius]OQR02127.1 PTS fructose transporter subunit IIB [Ligilactobacillus salivarius]
MKSVNVLSVCGSGTVTSSMVAASLKEYLEEQGIQAKTTESRPTEALQLAQNGTFDFIINTSPLPDGDYGVPIINATGLLTGFGEDEFYEEVLKVIDEL